MLSRKTRREKQKNEKCRKIIDQTKKKFSEAANTTSGNNMEYTLKAIN